MFVCLHMPETDQQRQIVCVSKPDFRNSMPQLVDHKECLVICFFKHYSSINIINNISVDYDSYLGDDKSANGKTNYQYQYLTGSITKL